mmetsp:Transcript_39362/g.70516  ORF Transcript_39362/g.70516 Transcript_39362/m.70516 type:complete len:106 (+) Transcript_39362:136-453(+)
MGIEDACVKEDGETPSGWKYVGRVKESHGYPIYCMAYNFIDLRHKDVFATVGKNQATVYQCKPDCEVDVLQVYLDPDVSYALSLNRISLSAEVGEQVHSGDVWAT